MTSLSTSIRRRLAAAFHWIGRRLDVHERHTAIIFCPDAGRFETHKTFFIEDGADIPEAFWREFHLNAMCGREGFTQPAIYISDIEINSQHNRGRIKFSVNYENRHSVFYEYYGAHIRKNDFAAESYEIRLEHNTLESVRSALDSAISGPPCGWDALPVIEAAA